MRRAGCALFLVGCATVSKADPGAPAGTGLSATDVCGPPVTPCMELAQSLVGPNIEVSNVTCGFKCEGRGTFSGGLGVLGFETGVILGTGFVERIAGPNTDSQVGFGDEDASPGDLSLEPLVPSGKRCRDRKGDEYSTRTCDANFLEFDFRYLPACQGSFTMSFMYAFASDEYNEYTIAQPNEHTFPDVFAFFLNGYNIALVPGTNSPVRVNTVNCGFWDETCARHDEWTYRDCPPYGGANCTFFRNNYFNFEPHAGSYCAVNGVTDFNAGCTNPAPLDTEMDGLTIPLTAVGSVNPTGINHIKLVIADVGDGRVDSNVFVKAGSFQCVEPLGACCNPLTVTCSEGVPYQECKGDWLAGVTCEHFNPPCRKQRMLILLDRTASMNAVREETHNTRCVDALDRAKQDVEEFFAANPNGEVAVWTFRQDGPTAHTPGFVDHNTAMAAFSAPGIETCTWYTPLAESMCQAVDALMAGVPNAFPGELVLAVSSDGIENASDGQCFGPSSTVGSECGLYSAGSWQQLVCDKVLGHSVVMARYWGEFSMVTAGGGIDVETGGVAGAGVSDYVFFKNLAETSGGKFTFLDDVAGPPTGACCDAIDRCQDGFTESGCTSKGGTYIGDGTDCSLVIECGPTPVIVPTLSVWGATVLSISTALAGTVVLRRRGVG